MNAEDKLKEMTDRGWHVKVSRQQSSDKWDLLAASDGWLFLQGKTYCTYGIHTSLFAALLDLEQQLLLEDSAL